MRDSGKFTADQVAEAFEKAYEKQRTASDRALRSAMDGLRGLVSSLTQLSQLVGAGSLASVVRSVGNVASSVLLGYEGGVDHVLHI
jgi:glycerate kinase